jgi:hypothetical protein
MDTTKNNSDVPGELIPLTPEEEAEIAEYLAGQHERELEAVRVARHAAYTAPEGSDAIFMKYQRDEATKEEWLAAKAAIDEALPYPEPPKPSKKKAS